MRRDPTEFRERFLRWRDTGESLYDAGRIRKYEDGKDAINYETLKSHSYRVPFIEDKAVRLTNAGLATGAVLSTNLLDSIADNAYAAGLPIKTAIGLVTKESTLTKHYILPNGKKVNTGKLSRIRMIDTDKAFRPLGYEPDVRNVGRFYVKNYPYTVGDLGQKNIGIDEIGRLRIFDPLIDL